MARPTDPAKLAALRARQARNSAAYRARKAAAKVGRVAPPDINIVQRAQREAQSLRERRAAVISSLPDIRNPRVTLRPPEQTPRAATVRKTRLGQQTQASRIRERANSERLQAIGRARQAQLRSELEHDPTGRLRENMTSDQRRRFLELSDQIASGSRQSLAILFDYAGGQGLYSSALERILASPESRDVEEGLAILEQLAGDARKAAIEYAPSRIGRLNV